MKVLHVITGLAAGGAEQQLHLLLRYQSTGAEVATLTNLGSVAEAIRRDGTVVHDLGMRRNTDVAALPRLARLIRTRRFDLVHTHLYRACVYGRLAARLAGVRPVVATEHSLGETSIEGRRLSNGVKALYLATERLGQTTIAVSTAVARRLRACGVPASRIETIPNGVDLHRYRFDPAQRARLRARLGIGLERFVVGTVGRLVPEKRTDEVMRAVSGLADVTVLVVGAGTDRAALGTLARQLRVDTVFVGEVTDVSGLLSAMDMLAAPSVQETFGLSVIEALTAGLPVAYGSCPALDDLAADPVPGAIRVSADRPALRNAVLDTIRAGPRRLAPPPALERYDIARVAGQVHELYERVIHTTTEEEP